MKESTVTKLQMHHPDKGWQTVDQPLIRKKSIQGFTIYNEEIRLMESVSKDFFIKALYQYLSSEQSNSNEISIVEQMQEVNQSYIISFLADKETLLSPDIFAKGVFKFKTKFSRNGEMTYELVGVYKEGFTFLLTSMGFFKRYRDKSDDYSFIHVRDSVMKVVTIDRMRSMVYLKLKQLSKGITIEKGGASYHFPIEMLTNIFIDNQHNIFNANTCELLSSYDVQELKDTKDSSYFLFKNYIVKVNAEGITALSYSNLKDRCVWESHILPHNFQYEKGFAFGTQIEKFICNVCNHQPDRIAAMRSAIGYILNYYNDSSMGQAVILNDEAPTSITTPEGGTGKGVLIQAIALMREVARLDGKFYNPDDKFRFQSINITTQVAIVDDLKPNIPFAGFFSLLTEGWTIEKKHEKQIKLPPESSPKLVFTSNSVLGGTGSSDKRRQFIVEFSDHYSKKIINGTETPIIDEHGGRMFDKEGWDIREWNGFYSFMLECSQLYFKEGLKPYELKGVAANRIIQGCGEDFAEWVERQNFVTNLEYTIPSLYKDYTEFYYDNDNFSFKQRAFTDLIKKFANIKGWKIEKYHKGTYPNKVVAIQFRTLGR